MTPASPKEVYYDEVSSRSSRSTSSTEIVCRYFVSCIFVSTNIYRNALAQAPIGGRMV